MFTFAIIFDGGFALTAMYREMISIVNGESGVKIKGKSSRHEAYVYTCTEHVKRELAKSPYAQPVVPKLEAMDDFPIFHSLDFIPQSVSQRVFAAVHPNYAGILTSSEAVADFFEFDPLHSEVQEVGSIIDAQHFINHYYLKYILPMGAYIEEAVPYLNNIPINVMIQMPYAEWIRKNCMITRQIPFAKYPAVEPLKEIVVRVPVSCSN